MFKTGGTFTLFGTERDILAVEPYTGNQSLRYTHLLRVTSLAPKGYIDIAVDENDVNTSAIMIVAGK